MLIAPRLTHNYCRGELWGPGGQYAPLSYQRATYRRRKTGLASAAFCSQYGVDQPDFWMLFDGMEAIDGATIAIGQLTQPGRAGDITFGIKKALSVQSATSAHGSK